MNIANLEIGESGLSALTKINAMMDSLNGITDADGDLIAPTVTLSDGILDWNGTTNGYQPYENHPGNNDVVFYSTWAYPTSTTSLFLNGILQPTSIYIDTAYTYGATFIGAEVGIGAAGGSNFGGIFGNNANGGGISTHSRLQNSIWAEHAGEVTSEMSAHTVYITRTQSGAGGSLTGDVIHITDNPTVTGAVTSKILSATIGDTERLSLNPRVANGTTAVAYFEDTNVELSTAGAKIHSFRNHGVEKALIDKDGSIEGGGTNFKITSEGGYAIKLTAGENLYKGEIVYVPTSGGANSTVVKAPTNNDMPLGVVYADALSAASVWVVVSGMTEVLPMTTVTAA